MDVGAFSQETFRLAVSGRGGQTRLSDTHEEKLSACEQSEKTPADHGHVSPFYSNAFQKREKANEDFAIRQREKDKLMELKKKLKEQQAHLRQLENHMYVLDCTSFPHFFSLYPGELPFDKANRYCKFGISWY